MARSDESRGRGPARSTFHKKLIGSIVSNKRHQEFLSHFMDPTSRGFGQSGLAAELAGYTNRASGSEMLRRPDIQAGMLAIDNARLEKSRNAMDYLRTFDQAAAEELVDQVFLGKDLELIDPQCDEALGKNMKGIDDKVTAMKAREINKHNQNITSLARERRAALELLLAYQFGRPQQSMHVTKEEVASVLPMDELSDDALRELQGQIQMMREEKEVKEIPVIVAEVLEEGE